MRRYTFRLPFKYKKRNNTCATYLNGMTNNDNTIQYSSYTLLCFLDLDRVQAWSLVFIQRKIAL